jgi:hypothetical protein
MTATVLLTDSEVEEFAAAWVAMPDEQRQALIDSVSRLSASLESLTQKLIGYGIMRPDRTDQ